MKLDLSVIIVNLFALVISTGALIITYKNRRTGLREKLFHEQLSAFKELSFKISRLESLIMDYNADKTASGGEFEEIREKIWNASDDFQDYYAAIEIFIPDEIDKQFMSFHSYINSIIKKINKGQEKVDIAEFSNQSYVVQETVRNFIGLDNLSNENKRLSKSKYL